MGGEGRADRSPSGMAITIATIGRLMKNLAMPGYLFSPLAGEGGAVTRRCFAFAAALRPR